MRVFSSFVVRYGDGTLRQVPVMYGDGDRQVSNIINQNSENLTSAVPKISIYITGLDIDHNRLADQTFVSKMHFREREIDESAGSYTQGQGRNYTVEKIMPTPFKLSMKCDIWASSTDQKLQILEQVLVFFNPSLELQTSENYVDWTSLTVLNLNGITWSSRQVPVGTDPAGNLIDVATLSLDTPIWISPPAKVKHLGVITKVITSLYNSATTDDNNYINGLAPYETDPNVSLTGLLSTDIVTITDYNILVQGSTVLLMGSSEDALPRDPTLDLPIKQGPLIDWLTVIDAAKGQYVAGSSMIYLTQPNGNQIVGTITIDTLDLTILNVSWFESTLNTNTGIDSYGRLDTDVDYNAGTNYRTRSPGTFDAIINPLNVGPGWGITDLVAGDRFLIIEDIGNSANSDGPVAWKNNNGSDFVATTNDIIEWTGTQWNIIFNASQEADTLIYQTNIYTGIQYMWNGVSWVKSFEGEYKKGQWRIEL
jgi:hypothetical protein